MDADVIVIGAGAAGLAAARRLAARSLRVIVLEGRDRVGGRAYSRRTGRAIVTAELGAEFIHGRARATMALLREAGSAAVDTAGESWVLDGSLRRRDDEFPAGDLFESSGALLDDTSVDRFLEPYERDPRMREQARSARAFAEGFEAVDPARASARSIGDEWRSGVDSRSARPLGGYARLVEYMQDACAAEGVSLRLETAVTKVTWARGAVGVDVREIGEKRSSLHARAAVITLPIGVLRQRGEDAVLFDPALPPEKQAALAKLEMGPVVRIVLEFRTAFWEDIHDGKFFNAAFFSDPRGSFASYWTQVPIRSELISAWAGGPKAVALAGASREALIERALHDFAALLGEPTRTRAEFVGAVLHDWNNDPFSRGAYSYVTVGGARARHDLGAPVDDTLFFAGEATSTDGNAGTVNGALETGARAAHEATAALAAHAR